MNQLKFLFCAKRKINSKGSASVSSSRRRIPSCSPSVYSLSSKRPSGWHHNHVCHSGLSSASVNPRQIWIRTRNMAFVETRGPKKVIVNKILDLPSTPETLIPVRDVLFQTPGFRHGVSSKVSVLIIYQTADCGFSSAWGNRFQEERRILRTHQPDIQSFAVFSWSDSVQQRTVSCKACPAPPQELTEIQSASHTFPPTRHGRWRQWLEHKCLWGACTCSHRWTPSGICKVKCGCIRSEWPLCLSKTTRFCVWHCSLCAVHLSRIFLSIRTNLYIAKFNLKKNDVTRVKKTPTFWICENRKELILSFGVVVEQMRKSLQWLVRWESWKLRVLVINCCITHRQEHLAATVWPSHLPSYTWSHLHLEISVRDLWSNVFLRAHRNVNIFVKAQMYARQKEISAKSQRQLCFHYQQVVLLQVHLPDKSCSRKLFSIFFFFFFFFCILIILPVTNRYKFTFSTLTQKRKQIQDRFYHFNEVVLGLNQSWPQTVGECTRVGGESCMHVQWARASLVPFNKDPHQRSCWGLNALVKRRHVNESIREWGNEQFSAQELQVWIEWTMNKQKATCGHL